MALVEGVRVKIRVMSRVRVRFRVRVTVKVRVRFMVGVKVRFMVRVRASSVGKACTCPRCLCGSG